MSKQDSNPRFTVIIPTKDRAEYLYHSLRTCAAQEYENLEVIVSDDGSTDDTRAVVEEAGRKDPRIRFVTPAMPGKSVGMLENFEYALDQVRPGYVLALGGDDGLVPHGICGMRDVLVDTGKELLAWPAPMYFYANVRMPMAQMVIHARRGRPHHGRRIVTSESFLRRQSKELGYVTDIESPMFYVKGVTSTRLVDRVRSRSGGKFYSCATPDGYSGIVLAGEVESYAFSGAPFSLHGVSPTSAGVSYYARTASARAQSEAFFAFASRRPMHRELGSQPYSPLIALMTADYLLTAADLPGWPGPKPMLEIRDVLLKGLAELRDGLYPEDRIARQLSILDGVARYHGLEDFFRRSVAAARRNRRQTLEGSAVSPTRVYLDATKLGIENVFDAAYFAYYAHSLSGAANMTAVWQAIVNSANYRVLSARKGAAMPDEPVWRDLSEPTLAASTSVTASRVS